jgi:tetratricopeptide (TPR) repeat protein
MEPAENRDDQAVTMENSIDSNDVESVVIYKKRPKPVKPFILPIVDVPTFTGRDEELKTLKRALIDARGEKVSAIAGLSGAGGIGKTALACHFAEIYKDHFPGGVIGIRVDNKKLDAIARKFAEKAGYEIDSEKKIEPSEIMQEVFRDRSMLLIFDNAETKEIRDLRPGGDKCAVLVTTRERSIAGDLYISEDASIDLPILPEKDALLLLEKFAGNERMAKEPEAALEIISLLGCLPLALEIVGRLLDRNPYRPLSTFASALQDEKKRLEKLKIKGDDKFNVKLSLSLSLNFLEEGEKVFFACLGVCAADGFSVRAAMAAVGLRLERVQELLDKLFNLSILNRLQEEFEAYAFHPLIRLLALEELEDMQLKDGALKRHAEYFWHFVKTSQVPKEEKEVMIGEDINDIILAGQWLVRQKKPDYEFLIRLWPFFVRGGEWEAALTLIHDFLQLAIEIEDRNAELQLRIQMAKYLSLQGHFEKAEQALAPIEGIMANLGDGKDRRKQEAMWLDMLGGVLQKLGRFSDAAKTFEKSIRLEEALGNKRGLAVVQNSLGGVLQKLGRFDEAVEAFKKSYRLELKAGTERGRAMVLNSLGGVLQRQGKFDEAATAFEKSDELLVKLKDERGQAMVQNSLGGVLQRQGKFEESVKAFEKSYDLEIKLGNERGQAMVQNSLGGVLQRQGKFDQSVKAFEKSYDLELKLGNERGQAMVQNSLGGVLQRQGKFDESVQALEKSIELGEKLGDHRHLAMAQNSLGGVLQRMGKFDEAVLAFEKSLKSEIKRGNKRGQAMVQNSLGNVYRRMDKTDEAIEEFEKSLDISIKINDEIGQAMVYTSLGKMMLKLKNDKKGLDYLNKGFEINEKLKIKQGLKIVTPALVNALLNARRRPEALDVYNRAIAISPAVKKIDWLREKIEGKKE